MADRSVFEQELDALINEAANTSNASTATTLAVQDRDAINATLRKRTASLQEAGAKKQKLEPSPAIDERVVLPSSTASPEKSPPQLLPKFNAAEGPGGTDTHSLYVHPSRRVLLDRPDPPQLRELFTGKHAVQAGAQRDSNSISSAPVNRKSTAHTYPYCSSEHAPTTSAATQRSDNKTWTTQRHAVIRQWDSRKDILEYEALLELRRNEKIESIDRYVPTGGMPKPRGANCSIRRRSTYFFFEKLPEPVRARVLSLLLVSDQPIKVNFSWLRSFIQGHSRVPSAYQTVTNEGFTYSIATTWNKVVSEVTQMQDDILQFKTALEDRAHHARKTRAPCRGLTTSLLRVSCSVHKQAAQVFYSQNTFCFPWASTAWMQLESFLATIGPTNISHLRGLRVHAPLWHRGIYHDFVEGAILDLTPPVSRLAIIKPPSHDRLLGAIQHSVSTLMYAGQLTRLEIELENGPLADVWSGRSTDSCRLISVSDAEEHTLRKQQCLKLLKQTSEALAVKPTLQLYHGAKFSEPDWAGFGRRFSSVVAEAEKYGWVVDPILSTSRR